MLELFQRLRAASAALPPLERETDLRFTADDLVWAMGSLCALNRKPFDADLLKRRFPPPYSLDSFVHAARGLDFKVRREDAAAADLGGAPLPCLVVLRRAADATAETTDAVDAGAVRPALLVQQGDDGVVLFDSGSNTPRRLSHAEFADEYVGTALFVAPQSAPLRDPDSPNEAARPFGFRWFVPELLKHRKVWLEVLVASLVIQLLALGTPLFTQVVIDKVVVHHTESTLIVIAVGLTVFMLFSALLTWVRQYLVLHTGNRVDAVLGSTVFEHLLKLPPRYFEHRPTGVISARLQGVENIREFIASAAVMLVLDLPFLLIFVGMMFHYDVKLSLIVLALVAMIMVLSLVVAPIFRAHLNRQFLLGARNQAFVTEYVAGIETVKSLQMEPQLVARYGDYLAAYLQSGFATKQVANAYNTVANGIEQLMALLVLVFGAYAVMEDSSFTIGMLIAFQMFAGRVSQPMLRLVGLWQQFQQASMSVLRLGDLMNAPAEPYSLVPSRTNAERGAIEISRIAFRYRDDLPYLYEDFSLRVEAGQTVAIMGPSGSGKSTLAKLLQGFYQPTDGRILIDGTDIRHLSANELRNHFGVVPQETVLFSGTIYDNLLMANPHATFEQVVNACRMAEIHTSIERLPQGYNTEIGERGAGLSGGQKQRLAIARALLKNPRILVFDEATSSLDAETAEHFAQTINQLRGRVTMLFVTHALPRSLQIDRLVKIGQDDSGDAVVASSISRHLKAAS